MRPRRLDHIALRVGDRDALAGLLERELELRVLERTSERIVVVARDGGAAEGGALVLLDRHDVEPEQDAQQTRLVSVILAEHERERPPLAAQGITFTFGSHGAVHERTPRHSVIGLTLLSGDPPITAAELEQRFGFELQSTHRDVATVGLDDALFTLVRARVRAVRESVLDHVALGVDSVERELAAARGGDLDVLDVQREARLLSLLVAGPEELRLQYLEHLDLAPA